MLLPLASRYRELVGRYYSSILPIHIQQRTKFQLPISISFGAGRPKIKKKWGLLIPETPLAQKFMHVALVSVNANQHTKFQLPSVISFGNMEGVPK